MRTRATGSPRSRLALLYLEDRTLPAVTASVVNGVLTVLGDGASDRITLGLSSGQFTVSGVAQTFSAAAVRAITVDGGAGDDSVEVSQAIGTPTLLFGGIGNDVLVGGGGADQLFGGPGNDALNGGGGGDEMYGGGGSDSINDPQGPNTVVQDTAA